MEAFRLLLVWIFVGTAAAPFPTTTLTDYLTVARQNSFYSSLWGCPAPTAWTTQNCASANSGRVQYTALNCFDGLNTTFCQTDTQSATTTSMFVIDLQEPRMVTTVGIMTRADCCQSREDTARVLLANTEAAPDSIVGATDCLNPGGGFPASTYRNYNCTGSAPARFVYLAVFCSATPCLAINPAEITVWGAVQTFPAVMSRIVFNAATSTMSSTQGGACGGTGTAQACASNAINGVISATDYAHSNVGANVTNYAWGMWDTGSTTTSIDHVFFATRNLLSATCEPVWHRDAGIQVAVSNDTASLANAAATPAAALCNANLGGANSGGNLNLGLVAPWNWYGGDCNMIGRYMWFRKVGGPINSKCDGFTTTSNVAETINAFNFAELQAWTSACPSLPNLVVSANTTLVNVTVAGCGAAGAANVATAATGSRCAQSCAAGAVRQRGGPAGTVACQAGEWASPSGIATGPIVCGAVCPPINSSTADPAKCSQTVANVSWASASASGTISDWYPTWKVYKSATASVMSLGEMEGRAVVVAGGGYLSLVGIATVFALNEPHWVATPQLTQAQAVVSDVQLGSNASVAGLTLRVNSSVEPVSFYLLKLFQGTSARPTTANISRVAGGVETSLLSTTSSSCAVLSPAWARVSFSIAGQTLNATCNGAVLGTVTDTPSTTIYVGTAGLYSTSNPTVITAVSAGASAVPAGTSSRFRNTAITRGCDGPFGGCNTSLPGETCNMDCPLLTTPANSASLVVTCSSGGQWSAAALVCYPSQTATVSQTQTASGTQTPSRTPTLTPTETSTPTPSPTPSTTPSASQSLTASQTQSPTVTCSSTSTPSVTQTRSTTSSATQTQTPSPSSTLSFTSSPTGSPTSSQGSTPSVTQTASQAGTPSSSTTASGTYSRTPSQQSTESVTGSASQALSSSQTSSASLAPTPSPTSTPSLTGSQTGSQALTPSPTQTRSPSQSVSVVLTSTPTPSATPTATQALSNTATQTASPSLAGSGTGSGTASQPPSTTTTQSQAPTSSASQAASSSGSQTQTASGQVTPTPSQLVGSSATQAASAVSTSSSTGTITGTSSSSALPSASPAATLSGTGTSSVTPTQPPSLTQSVSLGSSQSAAPETPTASRSLSQAQSASQTLSGVPTLSQTATQSFSGLAGSQPATPSCTSSGSPSKQQPASLSPQPLSASQGPTVANLSVSGTSTPTASSVLSSSMTASTAPSSSPSFSRTSSSGPSASGTASGSQSQTLSSGLTRSGTLSQVRSLPPAPSVTSTAEVSETRSGTASSTITAAQQPSVSLSISPSGVATVSASSSRTQLLTQSVSTTASLTSSQSVTGGLTRMRTPSPTSTVSVLRSETPSSTVSATRSLTRTLPNASMLSSSATAARSGSASAVAAALSSSTGTPSVGGAGSPSLTVFSPSSSASASASSSNSACLLVKVPLNVTVNGIPRSAILVPHLGVLLRLGLACTLGVPVVDVAIAALFSPAGDPTLTSVAPQDAVNMQPGPCSLLTSASNVSSPNASTPSPPTIVMLEVVACGVADVNAGFALPPLFIAKLADICNSSAATASASSPGVLFGAFLSAAAAATGVPPAAATVSVPVAGAASVVGTGSAAGPPSGAASAASTGPPTWMVPVVAAVVAVALCGVLTALALVLRRKRQSTAQDGAARRARKHADTATSPQAFGGLGVHESCNPMHGGKVGSASAVPAPVPLGPLPHAPRASSASDSSQGGPESWKAARLAALHRDQLPVRSPLAPQRLKAGSLDTAGAAGGAAYPRRDAARGKHGSFDVDPSRASAGSRAAPPQLASLRARPTRGSAAEAALVQQQPRADPTGRGGDPPAASIFSGTNPLLDAAALPPHSAPMMTPAGELAVFEFKTNPLYRSPRARSVVTVSHPPTHPTPSRAGRAVPGGASAAQVCDGAEAAPLDHRPHTQRASVVDTDTLAAVEAADFADFKPNPLFRPRGLSVVSTP